MAESARVDITGAVARTRLTQTFVNTTNNRIEGTYVFPLPEGAAVTGFAMMVNGKRTEGGHPHDHHHVDLLLKLFFALAAALPVPARGGSSCRGSRRRRSDGKRRDSQQGNNQLLH